jgi:glyceraldehyde-3-phosphate dehydrogenase (NADP+)
MFVAGKVIRNSQMIAVKSPYSGETVGEVASASAEDVKSALNIAEKGAAIMRQMSAGERADILEKAAKNLADDTEIAKILCSEVGKTIKEARAEVARSANTLKVSVDAARNLTGETVRFDLSGKTGKTGYFTRVPLGIVLAITPFNFPLNLACHKIGPAIAAGNAIIHKPATATPLTAIRLAEILVRSGLPAEALSVITGPGNTVGDMLLGDTRIRKVSFTGSVDTGTYISSKIGIKKLTMELGSNSAVIVFADVPIEAVARKIKAAGYACAGQVCISVQRVYVQEKVYESFLDSLIKEVRTIRTGDPLLEDTDMGSMINAKESERASRWVDEAIKEGAVVALRGNHNGSLLEPIILAKTSETCDAVTNEAFAPYVVVNSFKDTEDGIRKINASKYGLQAGIFTRDIDTALYGVENIEAGSVLINEVSSFRVDNMPYGGMKMSGIGREGPRFAIEEMTEPKLVIFNTPIV